MYPTSTYTARVRALGAKSHINTVGWDNPCNCQVRQVGQPTFPMILPPLLLIIRIISILIIIIMIIPNCAPISPFSTAVADLSVLFIYSNKSLRSSYLHLSAFQQIAWAWTLELERINWAVKKYRVYTKIDVLLLLWRRLLSLLMVYVFGFVTTNIQAIFQACILKEIYFR